MPRLLILFQIGSVSGLALLIGYVYKGGISTSDGIFILTGAALLLVACIGFVSKLVRDWSTRMLWEGLFIGALPFGCLITSKIVLTGRWQWIVGPMLVSLLFASRSAFIRALICMVGAMGAGIFFSVYIPAEPLWVLWVGLAIYDGMNTRARDLFYEQLTLLVMRFHVIAWLPIHHLAKTRVLISHLLIPTALIVQAGESSLRHGGALLIALLIGSWYAMMRPRSENESAHIVPWAALWMLGIEIVFRLIMSPPNSIPDTRYSFPPLCLASASASFSLVRKDVEKERRLVCSRNILAWH